MREQERDGEKPNHLILMKSKMALLPPEKFVRKMYMQ